MLSLLALSFHPAFTPPKSGGEQRLYYIYNDLSKFYDITLISFTYPNIEKGFEVIMHNENFREIRVSKGRISLVLHYLLYKIGHIAECSAIVTSLESKFSRSFKRILNDEIKNDNIIIFVSPYLFTIPLERLKDKKVVYESYNVEFELMKQTLSSSLLGRSLIRYVYFIEKSLSKRSNLIFSVSNEDKDKMAELYKIDKSKIIISPNGVKISQIGPARNKKILNERANCIFMGSYHPPNIEAIEKVIAMAKQTPNINFLIAGGASNYYLYHASDSLEPIVSFNTINCHEDICVSGFYGIEFWNNVPTIWSEPVFEIFVSNKAEFLEMKTYSPEAQRLEVETTNDIERFDLAKGFNLVAISLKDRQNQKLSFKCEVSSNYSKRKLGLALQGLSYTKGEEKLSLDLSELSHSYHRFKDVQNVILLGQVSDKEKSDLYSSSHIALNPMLSGSGTNIKMLDYMEAGLPVITTPLGARGLDIDNYHHAIICDITEFPEKIMELLNNRELYNELVSRGRKLVQDKYDWTHISESMANSLETRLG
ncbi:MAG: glycosyltransferase [Methanotrichaceae archaeon]|nr:glycosyltransferase [Methanotrichaceae archaeon]